MKSRRDERVRRAISAPLLALAFAGLAVSGAAAQTQYEVGDSGVAHVGTVPSVTIWLPRTQRTVHRPE